jgi:dephospho-CoA kinase
MAEKIVIGVTGTLCSGKGKVAEILKSFGCDADTFSSAIRDELRLKGIPEATRAQLQDEGNRLRKEFGKKVLAERLLKKYSASSKSLVIDGVRNLGEIDYLKNHSKFFLIGVDAPLEARWNFTKKRKTSKDFIDYEAFVALNSRDQGLNESESGQQVGLCLVQADFLIYNDEEFTKLEDSKIYHEVIAIYEAIMKKK